MNKHKYRITLQDLEFIVANNSKKRYSFNEDKRKIRANQGHSLEINLELKAVSPPKKLFHGTADKFLESIYENGLLKKQRHHVHLSTDIKTAIKVGHRHGKVAVFEVDSERMSEDGIAFFVSENNVWLTDSVPPKYLKRIK